MSAARARERFIAACADLTDESIRDLCAKTSLTYLGEAGPVFLLGTIRVRGTFTDAAGRYWADAALVAESLITGSDMSRLTRDYWRDAAGNCTEFHSLWIATSERGLWDATISPLDQIAVQLHLPAPTPFPDGWARSWNDFPTISDAQEIAIVAHGVDGGTAGWRNGGQR
ncbi:hypothetical protein [Actinacidiphila alni]|uniref:hypothetical protein n=1 Tax=Actinacidiphila alni TaxID=380248 RepID=UPI003452AFFF